jgi:hypothetical protein
MSRMHMAWTTGLHAVGLGSLHACMRGWQGVKMREVRLAGKRGWTLSGPRSHVDATAW